MNSGKSWEVLFFHYFSGDPNYSNVDKKYWDDMIRENDQNGDGLIDYNEFIDMMNKTKL